MRPSRILAAAATVALAATAAPASAAARPAPVRPHSGHVVVNECSASFFGGDRRLGPAALPQFGAVGIELSGYRRTGGLTVPAFLARFYDPAVNAGAGGWIYPPADGYVVGATGQPIEWRQQLTPGVQIDRYGSEFGTFLAPAGSPYAWRSIPPQNLDATPPAGCNYHDYKVIKPFDVYAGPVAPWFGQPGHGLQFQIDGRLLPGAPSGVNVLWLIKNGYLQRLV